MTKNKSNAMWGGRFASGQDTLMEALNASIEFDQRLATQDIDGSIAHALMLGQTEIITEHDSQQIIKGLEKIKEEIENNQFIFKKSLEDIHMNIESRLAELIGDTAGRLHTARSRNDQAATSFKLWVRTQIQNMMILIRELQKELIKSADTRIDWVMPGFTHLQTAQPITWGHHMLAYVEMFERDFLRFDDAKRRLNQSPLGSSALAGTSFPIDRQFTSKTLNFDGPTANSLDSVSDRDFALEFLSVSSICAMHLSRFCEEIVVWSSAQFKFVTLSDEFSTGSSIMPQKKNPDSAELIRAKIGRVFGSNVALMMVMKGLPLAYSKDMQEDKEQVFDASDNLSISLKVMTKIIATMKVHKNSLEDAASQGFSTATDLADWLVRELHLPFRKAHHITGAIVKKCEDQNCNLSDLSLEDMKIIEPGITKDVFSVLSVKKSVLSRCSFGGTSPIQVTKQILRWKDKLNEEIN
ncbi:MAG: argininosuccinate lyase [Paracoccaceae bacterium]